MRRNDLPRSQSVPGYPLLPPPGDLTLRAPDRDPNLSNFSGTTQYLDILFTHFREDFLSELRLALNDFKRNIFEIEGSPAGKRPSIDGGHYYQVVGLVGHDMTVSLVDYKRLQEDHQWNRSELLKTGSLIALSADEFSTWTYAIITGDSRPDRRNKFNQDREPKTRKINRVLTIESYDGSSLDEHLGTYCIWAIEPSSYFEAYRPVLDRIRRLQERETLLPFRQYIVGQSIVIWETDYSREEWHDAILQGMDDSQKDAIRHALTHELALIQGAPGTGKTHCGVNIIRILASQCRHRTTILIMAYTNNAVDNFVLQCERAGVDTDGLVRLGGQYCSDMSRFSLECRKNQWGRGVPGVLKRANIIAMTTTGAAKYQSLMDQVSPEVVLVEEAAQITEAHLIASLPSTCRHLILLGDYRQLRPHISEHAEKYYLDVSLFERLIRAGLPSATLELQYRMHPELVKVLVPNIYPKLDTDVSCAMYPAVWGVPRRVVFFNHESADGIQDERETRSKINNFECAFLNRFCQYLLQQGHKESSITILSTYKDQVHAIGDALKKLGIKVTEGTRRKSEHGTVRSQTRAVTSAAAAITGSDHESTTGGVRVTTVDGFQGEQNDIVLVSFVSSSETAFLDVNRVSASLSCAKHGFYALGNFNAYRLQASKRLDRWNALNAPDAFLRCKADHLRLWERLYQQWALEDKTLLDHLPILCQKHGCTARVSTLRHFDLYSPEGGCSGKCTERICSHRIGERYCHPDGRQRYRCEQPVVVIKSTGRRVSISCAEFMSRKLWEGDELFELSFSACNHKRVVSYQDVLSSKCIEEKTCERDCGHSETIRCEETLPASCRRKVKVELSAYGCSHPKTVECYMNTPIENRQLARECHDSVLYTCQACHNPRLVPCNMLEHTQCLVKFRLERDCGHVLPSVPCGLQDLTLSRPCREMVPVSDVRPCGHVVGSLYCCDFQRGIPLKCTATVTTGSLCWKKDYPCHVYRDGGARCILC